MWKTDIGLRTAELIDMSIKIVSIIVLSISFILSFFVSGQQVRQSSVRTRSMPAMQIEENRQEPITYSSEVYQSMTESLYGIEYVKELRREAERIAEEKRQQQQKKLEEQNEKQRIRKESESGRAVQFPQLEIVGISSFGDNATFNVKEGSNMHFLNFRKNVFTGKNPFSQFLILRDGMNIKLVSVTDGSLAHIYSYEADRLSKYKTE